MENFSREVILHWLSVESGLKIFFQPLLKENFKKRRLRFGKMKIRFYRLCYRASSPITVAAALDDDDGGVKI